MTISDYLDRVYLPNRLSVQQDSAKQLRIATKQFDAWAGAPSIGKINDDRLCRFLRHLVNAGLAASTVNSKRRMLLTLLSHAWRRRTIRDMPRDVARALEPKKLPEAWTANQVQRLVEACRRQPGTICGIPAGIWWSSLSLSHYYTAPRIGALIQAKTTDVDVTAGWLILKWANSKTSSEQLHWLPEPALDAVREIYSNSRQWLWPWPYHRNTLFTWFRRIVESVGLPAPRSHCQLFYRLRRSTISLAAADSLEAARRLAGHASTETTLKHYVDPRVAESVRPVRPPLPPVT